MEPIAREDEHRGEIAAALDVWRDSLVSLSGVNRLIKFKATKTGALVIDSPSGEAVRARLRAGALWTFQGGEDETDQAASGVPASRPPLGQRDKVLYTARPHKELGMFLRGLMRRATSEYLDRGLSVLYLAFGMLRWHELDGTAMTSPLVLVPVRLVPDGPKSIPRLGAGADDTVLNPALVLRMREFGVNLPVLDDFDESEPAEVLELVRAAVSGRQGWVVEDAVVLSLFSFHKEAMYRDLVDNEVAILGHPVVRALATKDPARQSGEFLFEPISAADIDGLAPPEDTPLVLDADSSQRAAVAAAVAGHSFVLDGPPGTGKSQTIANMIGALLHAGRTVLFVSEKAAALEVVRNRLDAAGLANFLLELHSHKAGRKQVVAELARALDAVTAAPDSMDPVTRSTLADRRRRLSEYAAAMNTVREPLSFSLHRVLGMLACSSDVPAAPVPEGEPQAVTQTEFLAIGEHATRLARAWRPVRQGRTYLWRQVVDDSSLDVRLYQAESALAELEGIVEVNAELADAFELGKPGDAATIAALLAAQHVSRPALALDGWLVAEDWSAVVALGARLAGEIDVVRGAELALSQRAGVEWTTLPDPAALRSPERIVDRHEPLDLRGLTAVDLVATAERFNHTADRMAGHLDSLRSLARGFGLDQSAGFGLVAGDPPDAADMTFAAADKLLTLVELGFQTNKPVREWLGGDRFPVAWNCAGALYWRAKALDEAEAEAAGVFSTAALTAPVRELNDRFANYHKGLKKLSGAHRGDREALSALLAPNVTLDQGISGLPAAVRWVEAVRGYEASVARLAGALGPYWRGRNTDFGALSDAFGVARRAFELVGDNELPAPLADYLCVGEPPTAYASLADDMRRDLDLWKASLAPAPVLAGPPELVLDPIAASIGWLRAHVAPMRAAADRVRAVDAATGRAHTSADAEELLALRAAAADTHAAIAGHDLEYAEAFGALYGGPDTDVGRLERSLTWAEEVRGIVNGPCSGAQVKALAGSRATDNLGPAVEKWAAAKERMVDAFAPERHPELNRELDDYRGARELIGELRDDDAGQQEWFAYTAARAELAGRGLDAVVDFCVEQRLPAEQVPEVIERAVLRGWADAVIRDDPRLAPFFSADRDALVDEFRTLDRQLNLHAAGDIVAAANSRRPSAITVGEPGVIRREALKRSRHLPVRELIARTRTVAPAIKPCFMMSPLAVSQFLPPDMRFDVVIFDEASQVTPGDAVNCVYRGSALILAGDDKQLPPTSFFSHTVDDTDLDDTDIADFQSVLELAKGSGAFTCVGLTWHYRSRHEALIAFSNRRFYDDRLVTYPSTHSAGSSVGVAFYHAGGVYHRGGGADNPVEAALVAERVIEHFTQRPGLTLGVVTFSVPQAEAIALAVDQIREQRRDLDRFFDSDNRLDAFFVKSLESVQGDERDVIIFSVGYGPDETGRVTANFGVLNRPKGWRRLNVAITRARRRVEVVASLRAADIPASDNENVAYFRAYLDYAEHGAQQAAPGAREQVIDPLGRSVLETVRSWGYVAEAQVGAAGFRVDVGVRHPAAPEVFALGVEYDGFQYQSAPVARDRDRLRAQVLRGLGWRLHRVWGIAWYRNRQQEEHRLRAAIEAAIADPIDARMPVADPPPASPDIGNDFEMPSWAVEYQAAEVPQLPRWADPSNPDSRFHMTEAIVTVAAVEGPVHIDLVRLRLRAAWGLGRMGYQVRENIDAAIQHAEVVREGDFIDSPNRPVSRVRKPGEVADRTVAQVHESELRLAMILVLHDAAVADADDLTGTTARVFGWPRPVGDVRRRLLESVDQLVRTGEILRTPDGLTLPGAG
jgi:hypothetical protein